jgi:hypothetical protein
MRSGDFRRACPRDYRRAMNSRKRAENRADLARILLALGLLALLSTLDETRAPRDPRSAQSAAVVSP